MNPNIMIPNHFLRQYSVDSGCFEVHEFMEIYSTKMKAILCIHSASAEFIQTAFSHNEIKTLSLASLLSHRPRLQLSFLLLSLVPFFPLLRSVLARVGLQEFLPLLVSVVAPNVAVPWKYPVTKQPPLPSDAMPRP